MGTQTLEMLGNRIHQVYLSESVWIHVECTSFPFNHRPGLQGRDTPLPVCQGRRCRTHRPSAASQRCFLQAGRFLCCARRLMSCDSIARRADQLCSLRARESEIRGQDPLPGSGIQEEGPTHFFCFSMTGARTGLGALRGRALDAAASGGPAAQSSSDSWESQSSHFVHLHCISTSPFVFLRSYVSFWCPKGDIASGDAMVREARPREYQLAISEFRGDSSLREQWLQPRPFACLTSNKGPHMKGP